MKNLITKHKLNPFGVLIGAILLYLTFAFLTASEKWLNQHLPLPTIVTQPGFGKSSVVFIMTIISLIIGLGFKGIAQLLGRPQKPVKNFIIWFVISFVIAFISGLLLTKVLKIPLAANPGHKNVWKTIQILPLQLFFEEGISFFILIVCANLLFKVTKNWKVATIIGSIISAIVFGLLHYSTYYYVSPFDTIMHILLVQGVARIGFNEGGLRSNSMWIPYLIHVTYDFVTFII